VRVLGAREPAWGHRRTRSDIDRTDGEIGDSRAGVPSGALAVFACGWLGW